MKRSGYIQRSAPPRRKRSRTRRGQPTAEEKEAERDRVYERCGGTCELRDENGKPLSPKHLSGILPSQGSVFERWHLVHVKAKRRFGWRESDGNTLKGGCYWCHAASHNAGGKPVPAKVNE
jgi:hypothetical protein